MDSDAFDTIVASADPAMVIVTCARGEERSGCLVGFHSQSSIDPLRYSVWISKANHTYGLLDDVDWLAVHVLGGGHFDLARLFGTTSGDVVDKFAACEVVEGPHGVPILAACPNRFVARKVATFENGGDHALVVIEPAVAVAPERFEPLRFGRVADLTPGHEADDFG